MNDASAPGSLRVVIVGGGIAGLELATSLSRGRPKLQVTLIDRSLSHVWKPMLHSFAAGTVRHDHDRIAFYAEAAQHGFQFMPGALAGVNRVARRIELAPLQDGSGATVLGTRFVDYDALIVTIGSRANDFGIQGVAQHCYFIDSLDEADGFNARFRSLVLQSIAQDSPLKVGIVGGGATGVELAAELHKALDLAAAYGGGAARRRLEVTLVETGQRILPAFPEKVSAAAQAQLEALGIRVMTGTEVVAADAGGLVLKDGARIDTTMSVWAAGVKAPAAMEAFDGLERARAGQLLVTPTLQTTLDPAIFALGDCARLATDPVPATAQAARQQALYLGKALRQIVSGGQVAPFRYQDKGGIVSLGDYNGWGTLGKIRVFGGGRLRGLSARLGHALLFRQHQLEIYGVRRGMLAWLVDLLDGFVRPKLKLD